MVNKHFQIEMYMKDVIYKVSLMEMENTNGKMVQFIKDNSLKAFGKEKVQ